MLLRFRFWPKKNLGGVAGDAMVLLTITRWRQASHPQNFYFKPPYLMLCKDQSLLTGLFPLVV